MPFPSAGTAGCFWTFSCFPEDVKRDWHCRQQSCTGHTAVVSTGQGVVQRSWHLPVSRVSEDTRCSGRLDRLSSAKMSLEVCVTLDETRYLICSPRSNYRGGERMAAQALWDWCTGPWCASSQLQVLSPAAPRNACSESHTSPQGMPCQNIGRVQSYASVLPS